MSHLKQILDGGAPVAGLALCVGSTAAAAIGLGVKISEADATAYQAGCDAYVKAGQKLAEKLAAGIAAVEAGGG